MKLRFDDPITAVVGPNGSGKSNISDAMRWVLGETSAKQLRGDRMEDIIFAGTDEQRPLNFAEVKMTFENEEGIIPIDYHEVVIRRRVFRTGDSEYYINDTQVRLRDIRELFLDTGVGKEGYSIIGQGRINEILSSRPVERRQIFEEASGIARDQYKKDQSIKRLEKTVDHLTRVRDIIEEQKKRLSFLEKQAKAAKKAKILEEQIKDSDLYYAVQELKDLSENLKKDRKTLNSYQIREGKLEKEIAKQKAERDELIQVEEEKREKLEILQKEERALFFDRTTKSSEIQKLEDSKRIHAERMEDWKKSLGENNRKYSETLEKLKSEEEKLQSLKTEISKKTEEEKIFVERKDALQKEISEHEEELLTLEKEKEKRNQEITDLWIRKKATESYSFQQEEEIKTWQEEILKIEEDLEIEEDKLKSLKNEWEVSEKEKTKLFTQEENLKEKLRRTSKEEEEVQSRLRKLETHLLEITQKRKFLKEVQENYEGYYYSVRRLLSEVKGTSLEKGIIGTVADSIRVKEGYEKVIDILLSSRLQNIIVKSGEDAADLIAYLKKNRIGTCTFLPVDRVSFRQREQAVDSRILAVAIDVVEFDKEIRPVMEHLLNQTVITKDIYEAESLAQSRKTRSRIASLDGDIINQGGSMVGGHRGKRKETGLINRQSELEEILKEEGRLKDQKEQLILLLEGILKKKDYFGNQIIDIQESLESRKSKSMELQFQKEGQSRLLKDLHSNLKRTRERIQKRNKEDFTEEDEKTLKSHQSFLEKLETNLNEQKVKLDSKKDILEDLKRDAQKLGVFLDIHKRDFSLQENTILDLKDLESTLKREISETQIKIKHREKEEQVESKQLEKLKSELQDLLVQEKSLEDELPNLENEWSVLKEKLEQVQEALHKNKNDKMKIHYEIENFKKKCMDSFNKRIDIKTKVQEDYQIDLEDFIVTKDPISKEKLEKLKMKRKKLGFVSEKDIEEYNEAKKEFDFLSNQEEDLTKSKEDTRKIILELDRKMTSSFLEAFEEIQESFGRIFKVLFDGGEAKLFLEEEDALTAGVEIMARPPGKKPQSLNLLSGGEKALTAVALLFAIFETNPSPFCILDEIDASLDEANIGRYSSYLKSLTDKTQFIIITHRKRTMEIGDKIYGVSMQEEGISSVIPLNLEDYTLEENR